MRSVACQICDDTGQTLDDEFGDIMVDCPRPNCDKRVTVVVRLVDGGRRDFPRATLAAARETIDRRRYDSRDDVASVTVCRSGDDGW